MDPKLRSVLLFDIPADVPHRVLTAATDAGLVAARALATSAEATGALGSAKDEKRRVRIEMTLRVEDPKAAMGVERAFADAFLATLAAKGHDATRA